MIPGFHYGAKCGPNLKSGDAADRRGCVFTNRNMEDEISCFMVGVSPTGTFGR